MRLALAEARYSMEIGEVPVGALIVRHNMVIAKCCNLMKMLSDVTAHAEILAIKEANMRERSCFLVDCDIYTTLEPCVMCSGAIALARIRRLYFGAYDKAGAVCSGVRVFDSHYCHHKPEIYGGIMEEECAKLLTDFFSKIRDQKRRVD